MICDFILEFIKYLDGKGVLSYFDFYIGIVLRFFLLNKRCWNFFFLIYVYIYDKYLVYIFEYDVNY